MPEFSCCRRRGRHVPLQSLLLRRYCLATTYCMMWRERKFETNLSSSPFIELMRAKRRLMMSSLNVLKTPKRPRSKLQFRLQLQIRFKHNLDALFVSKLNSHVADIVGSSDTIKVEASKMQWAASICIFIFSEISILPTLLALIHLMHKYENSESTDLGERDNSNMHADAKISVAHQVSCHGSVKEACHLNISIKRTDSYDSEESNSEKGISLPGICLI